MTDLDDKDDPSGDEPGATQAAGAPATTDARGVQSMQPNAGNGIQTNHFHSQHWPAIIVVGVLALLLTAAAFVLISRTPGEPGVSACATTPCAAPAPSASPGVATGPPTRPPGTRPPIPPEEPSGKKPGRQPPPPPPPPPPAGPPAAKSVLDVTWSAAHNAAAGTCQTGGSGDLFRSIIQTPSETDYARVDFVVPDGFTELTLRVGPRDGGRNGPVHVSIQVGTGASAETVFNEKILYGDAKPVSVPVVPGQRVRIQAGSATGTDQVCIGTPLLRR